jgi:hypothetical protein
MTDMDSGLDGSAKDGQGDQHNSSVNTETEMPSWAAEIVENQKKLDAQVRSLQSGKDKGIANLQKELKETQGAFEEVFALGQKYDDPVEAKRNWWIDQQMRAQTQGADFLGAASSQQNVDLAGQGSTAGNVDTELLKQYGIDPQSAEYAEQVKAGKVGLEAALAIMAARQIQQVGGAATGASGGGTGTSQSVATAQQVLRDQYNEELDNAQKASGGVLPALQLYKIQEKYHKLGLEGLW